MNEKIVLDILKSYFSAEISNAMNFNDDSIELFLENGNKVKIYTKAEN